MRTILALALCGAIGVHLYCAICDLISTSPESLAFRVTTLNVVVSCLVYTVGLVGTVTANAFVIQASVTFLAIKWFHQHHSTPEMLWSDDFWAIGFYVLDLTLIVFSVLVGYVISHRKQEFVIRYDYTDSRPRRSSRNGSLNAAPFFKI